VSEPPLPPASPPQPARGRRAILKAAIKERQAGKPAEEIYKTYQGQVRPNNALAMAIASVADPERKRRYAVLNYVLVALLVLLAVLKALSVVMFSNLSPGLMAGAVVLGLIVPLGFAYVIARFDGRMYSFLIALTLVGALKILFEKGNWLGKLADLVLPAAIIAVAFVAQRKIFPNMRLFRVKKDAGGSYVWARRLAEATAASSSLPPATPPSPAPPAATPPHRRNWWSRNWVWFVPAGCLTMLVCLALVVCAFVLVAVSAVKSSGFYQTGVARAKSDARVQAALGSDLHDGMFLPGDTRMNGSLREYEFRIPISGSKGKGTIYLVVAKSAGQYQIDNLSVKTTDGEIIDLNEMNPSSVSNATRDQSNPATAQAESQAKPLFKPLIPSRALDTSPHIRGDPDAPVTLEVFEDFACKPCAQQSESLKQLEQTYHGKVQVTFHNFPLADHRYAREAAYAAEAAGLQGRFWEMHDILYRDQADWVDSGGIAVCASKIGLSIYRYSLDSRSEAVRQRVEADQKKGVELGVTRLPAIFLNGRLLDLRSLNPRGLRSEIDAALNGSPSP
jgi:protein-disulfide isomerase